MKVSTYLSELLTQGDRVAAGVTLARRLMQHPTIGPEGFKAGYSPEDALWTTDRAFEKVAGAPLTRGEYREIADAIGAEPVV